MHDKKSLRERLYLFLIKLLAIIAVAIVAAIVISSVWRSYRSRNDEHRPIAAAATAGPISLYNPTTPKPAETLVPGTTAVITPAPTVAPTPTQEPSYEYLPIYNRGETTEKVIAVTLDDLSQPAALERIVAAAENADYRLTLFPSGPALENAYVGVLIKKLVTAYGWEVENRGYSSAFIYRMNDTDMAKQIWELDIAVDAALAQTYQMHFYRPYGAMGARDQRTHNYLKQLGYSALVTWTVNGTAVDEEALREGLEPGNIYLFSSTNEDIEKMNALIRYALSAGYRVVTLNELLGYDENERNGFDASYLFATVPELENTDWIPETLRKGDCSNRVYLVQKRLVQLGYMEDAAADGVYGTGTASAVAVFQARNGEVGTGICTPELQLKLFGTAAIANDR